MKRKIPLTKYIEVPDAAHIVYFFEDENDYIENVLAYICRGIEKGDHLLIIENNVIYEQIEKKATEMFSEEQLTYIHYIDNHSFYSYHQDYHIHSIVEHFHNTLEPFLTSNVTVRTWAHVEWEAKEDIERQLDEFEQLADCSVNEMGLVSVCAYPASAVSASLQTAMMRSHEYLMTDKELVRSSLYKKPSLRK
ncbi:MEDS domain-containing protein [Salsuginibacillus kocurii]|uniref:MEDS domain-containing protein n=1 Tax=Salsuginibacillus kocurii TaxID=427078 RepID=UPI0003788906|nr:MEDS domain-containing protein [Salsuginibacillus kocurii]